MVSRHCRAEEVEGLCHEWSYIVPCLMVARVILFIHVYIHYDEVKLIIPAGLYSSFYNTSIVIIK